MENIQKLKRIISFVVLKFRETKSHCEKWRQTFSNNKQSLGISGPGKKDGISIHDSSETLWNFFFFQMCKATKNY